MEIIERSCPKGLYTRFWRVKVQRSSLPSRKEPVLFSEVSLSPFSELSAAAQPFLPLELIGNGNETSYGINQRMWMSASLPLHPQTMLSWLFPSLLLDFQLCEEHFLEQSFFSVYHRICFLFHLIFFFHSNKDTILMVKNWVKYLETLWSSGCCYITSMFKLKPKHPPSCRACALKQWKREMITTTKSLHAHDRHLNQSPGAHSHRSYLIFQSTPLSTSKTTGYHWRACTSPALDLELKHLVIKLFLFAYHSPFYLLRLPS